MERKLPTITLEGTIFTVDIAKGEFREEAYPRNTISFEMLVREGEGYVLFYDPIAKNLPRPERYQHPDIVAIDIPALGTLDLEGMALKYGRKIEEIKGKTDFEIVVDQKVLNERLAGVLPQIDIYGQLFIVDMRLGELRPKDDFSSRGIHLAQMEQYPLIDPQTYRFFYDTKLKEAVSLDTWELMEVPKHHVIVEVPIGEKMDPVRVAKLYNLDLRDFLMKYPPQSVITARIVPWEESGLLQRISDNRKREQKNRMVSDYRAKKEEKKKKGRSL